MAVKKKVFPECYYDDLKNIYFPLYTMVYVNLKET